MFSFVRTWHLFSFFNVFLIFKKYYIYLFLERGEGREKEERNHMWLPLTWPPLGTWPTTQVYALTGNWTGDPLVCSPHSIHWATPVRAEPDFESNWTTLHFHQQLMGLPVPTHPHQHLVLSMCWILEILINM